MNRKQDDAKNVDIERLQDVQASMKQTLAGEKAVQEKAELDANLKGSRNMGHWSRADLRITRIQRKNSTPS